MPNPIQNPIIDIGTTEIPNASVFRGIINNQYVKGVVSVSWNSRSGGTSKIVFKGPQEHIIPVAELAKQGGYEYSMNSGHIWTLEVTFPFDVVTEGDTGESIPLWTWELINTPFEKDILECGDRPFNLNLSIDTVRAIEQKLKNPDNGQPPYTIIDVNNGFSAVNAQVAYTLKSIGVHGKQNSLQTLRRTMIISNFYDATDLIQNVDDYLLFTTDEWLDVYNSDANPLNHLPEPIVNVIPYTATVNHWDNNAITQVDISGYNMDGKGIVTFIGWLQFPAEFQMISVNKVQVTQHWVFNQWSAGPWGLYDTANDALQSPNPNDVYNIIS